MKANVQDEIHTRPTPKLTPEIVNAAIMGMEAQKEKSDAQIAELRAMLNGHAGTAAKAETAPRKRRKTSAAGRRAIAEAQRKRWAAVKGQSETTTPEPAKPKRTLSAAARAKLAANLKKARAAKAVKAESARTKKAAPALKKVAVKKAAAKAAPAKAAKKSAPVKRATKRAPKKTASAAAQVATEAGAQ